MDENDVTRLLKEPTIARYPTRDGGWMDVPYDPDAPCAFCGLPVIAASMGGTACCPWCDLGVCRLDRAHRVDDVPSPRDHYRIHHADAPAVSQQGG